MQVKTLPRKINQRSANVSPVKQTPSPKKVSQESYINKRPILLDEVENSILLREAKKAGIAKPKVLIDKGSTATDYF